MYQYSPTPADPNDPYGLQALANMTVASPTASVPAPATATPNFSFTPGWFSGGGLPGVKPLLGGAGTGASKDFSFWSKDGFNAISSIMGGVGNLAQGWAAIKSLGLAQDSIDLQKEFANKNYEASKVTINNRIADQNAWKTAQGRTDLAKLVV